MRTLALVVALTIGTAAIAQDQAAQPAADATMQQPMAQDAAPPADQGAMPPANTGATPPADPSTTSGQPMESGQAMTPPADAAAPMTQTQPAQGMSNATGMQGMTAPPSEYPLCSRTVKDRCRNRGGK